MEARQITTENEYEMALLRIEVLMVSEAIQFRKERGGMLLEES